MVVHCPPAYEEKCWKTLFPGLDTHTHMRAYVCSNMCVLILGPTRICVPYMILSFMRVLVLVYFVHLFVLRSRTCFLPQESSLPPS